MKELKQTEINQAASILANGGIVAFPTETVFGLGVIFDNENSYNRLNIIKKRPPEKPYTLMCADPDDVFNYIEKTETCQKLVNKFMPGQITLIGKSVPGLPSWCVSSNGTVGVRVPDLKVIRDLIRMVGKPLLVPSANKSGEIPANTDKEAKNIFNEEIDAIIEGESFSKTPSTIILIDNDSIKMIREGVLKMNDIEEALK